MKENNETTEEMINNVLKENEEKVNDDEIRRQILNSYGAVLLDSGEIVTVKYNFKLLEIIWKKWNKWFSIGDQEEIKKLKEKTDGGIFDTGDVLIKIESIKMMLKPDLYFNSSSEEILNCDLKNSLTNKFISNTIYDPMVRFIDDDMFAEDENEDDDED